MTTRSSQTALIPVEEIELSYRNPRLDFSKESLKELADSLRRHGQIQPIVVRRKGEKYELVVGERRVRAAIYGDIPALRAEVVDLTDEEADARRLIENIQRKDLDIWEKVNGLETFWETHLRQGIGNENLNDNQDNTNSSRAEPNDKFEELSKVVGISPDSVRQWYQVARDTATTQERSPYVRKLPLSSLQTIAPLPSKEQEKLARVIVKNELSRDDVRALVKLFLKNPMVDVNALAERAKTKLETIAVTLPKERAEEIRKESQNYMKRVAAKGNKALKREVELRKKKESERRQGIKPVNRGQSPRNDAQLVTRLTREFIAHKSGTISTSEQYNQVMSAYASGRLTRSEANVAVELWKSNPSLDFDGVIREAKSSSSEFEARKAPMPMSLLVEPELYRRIHAYANSKHTDFKDAVYALLDYALDRQGFKGRGV